MILSGLKIKEEQGKNIFITPFNDSVINPNKDIQPSMMFKDFKNIK